MPHLPEDVAATLKHAARHPDGGAPLLEGNLESVAALYQLHPSRIERVRAVVAEPAFRSLAEAILAAAEAQPDPVVVPRPSPTARSLIASASGSPARLEFLTKAPIENAALLFESHPFVVEEARLQIGNCSPA
jgi:hypothetical protein